MATVTSFINGGGGAGEYSSIAAWEADKDGTSNAADTERLEISIVGSETGNITLAGWTAKTGGNEIQIEWLGDAFHAGLTNRTSSNAYVIERMTFSHGSSTHQDTVITGAFLDKAIGSVSGTGFFSSATNDVGSIKYVRCIVDMNGEAGDAFGNSGTADFIALNSVAMNGNSASGNVGFEGGNSAASEIYNCLAIGPFQRGMNDIGNIYNSWSLDNSTHDVRETDLSYSIWDIAGSGVIDTTGNNPDGILTDVDTAAANTILVADLTGGAEDFTPIEFSDTSTYNNIAIENGNDYSGTYPELANDITGQARGVNPTIGPYEVVSVAGPALPIFDHHYRMMRAA